MFWEISSWWYKPAKWALWWTWIMDYDALEAVAWADRSHSTPVYAARFGVRNPILFRCSRQYDKVKWLDERIFHSLIPKNWCHFLTIFCKTALRKPGEQGGESTCHSLHWPNLALLDQNFSQVLVHFLIEKMFHFQHDVGNALRHVIAACFPGF